MKDFVAYEPEDMEFHKLTFNFLDRCRKIQKFLNSTTPSNEEIIALFRPCLKVWPKSIVKHSEETIKKTLASKESDLIDCPKGSLWSIDPDTKSIWDEHAVFVYNIFESCYNSWKTLAWPDQEECLKFGSDMFKQMNEVFKTIYVPGLHHIITKDNIFDHQEIVLALNALYKVFQWVKDIEKKLEKLFESLNETEKLEKRIKEAEDVVLEETEKMVTLFCENQRSRFQKMIKEGKYSRENDFHDDYHEEETNTALGYLNAILKFLEDNLTMDIADGSQCYKDRYHKKITEELFKICEDELLIKMGKSDLKDEDKRKLNEAMEHAIDFRREISLDERPEIVQAFTNLEISTTPTSALISQFLTNLDFSNESSRGNLTIVVKKESYDWRGCSVEVFLKSVSNLVPRKTKSSLNFSLSLSILPNSPEMKKQKYKTKTFKETTHHIFDLCDDQDKVEEQNYVFNNVGPNQFLHIVVYDHSSTHTNKIFRGLYQLPIESLSEREGDRISGKFLTLSADLIQNNPIWEELIHRKDTMSSKFVKMIQNYIEEGRKPSIRT